MCPGPSQCHGESWELCPFFLPQFRAVLGEEQVLAQTIMESGGDALAIRFLGYQQAQSERLLREALPVRVPAPPKKEHHPAGKTREHGIEPDGIVRKPLPPTARRLGRKLRPQIGRAHV